MTSIRAAIPADAGAIAEIYNHYIAETTVTFELTEASVEDIAGRIERIGAHSPFFVLEENQRVLGYAYAAPWQSRPAYRHSVESTIYLHREATGRGLGSKLYRHLLDELRQRNVHTVIAGIALPNAASVALHESLGFVNVSRFQEVGRKFDRWIDVGHWQKMLG